jgi:hypothetical protein
MRKQRVILEEQTNAALARGHIDSQQGIKQHAPVQHDATAIRLLQPRDRPQRHRLARAGRPQQTQRRPVRRKFDGEPETRHTFFNRDFE